MAKNHRMAKYSSYAALSLTRNTNKLTVCIKMYYVFRSTKKLTVCIKRLTNRFWYAKRLQSLYIDLRRHGGGSVQFVILKFHIYKILK